MDPALIHSAPAPRLAIYRGDEQDDDRGDRLDGRATLGEFFTRWFVPIVLVGESDAKTSTVAKYGKSLDYWRTITGDPSLDQIDDYTLADFKARLRVATHTRGPLAKHRPLAPFTIAGHAKNVSAILRRTGRTVDPRFPCAGLLESAPYLRVNVPKRQTPGPAFTLVEARAIVAAASRLERFEWVARFALMFYCGLRVGSVLALKRSAIVDRDGRPWLVVNGGDVKTGNALAAPLHADAVAAIRRLPAAGPDAPLVPWSMHRRTIHDHHERLQRLAGIETPRGFHAWRRMYAEQMTLVGADAGQLAAKAGLDHSAIATGQQFYCNARALLVDRLPSLLTF